MPAKKMKIKKLELFWYIVAGLFALSGLVFIVFGIIGDHLAMLPSDNWIRTSEASNWPFTWLHLGYRPVGVILLLIGAFAGMIALTVFAREGDRDAERRLRRQQRLAIENEPAPEQPSPETAK